jgi:uncharacterized protein YhaN
MIIIKKKNSQRGAAATTMTFRSFILFLTFLSIVSASQVVGGDCDAACADKAALESSALIKETDELRSKIAATAVQMKQAQELVTKCIQSSEASQREYDVLLKELETLQNRSSAVKGAKRELKQALREIEATKKDHESIVQYYEEAIKERKHEVDELNEIVVNRQIQAAVMASQIMETITQKRYINVEAFQKDISALYNRFMPGSLKKEEAGQENAAEA